MVFIISTHFSPLDCWLLKIENDVGGKFYTILLLIRITQAYVPSSLFKFAIFKNFRIRVSSKPVCYTIELTCHSQLHPRECTIVMKSKPMWLNIWLNVVLIKIFKALLDLRDDFTWIIMIFKFKIDFRFDSNDLRKIHLHIKTIRAKWSSQKI